MSVPSMMLEPEEFDLTSGFKATTPQNEPAASDLSGPPKNHTKYYMDDPMAIFLAGNRLFKVHRHFLVQESPVFECMFLCPSGGSDPDGFSNERAIPLHGVTAIEFETLLDFFYTEKFQRHTARMQEWIDLLAISTRYDFHRLREGAIDAIDHSRWPPAPRHFSAITIDPIQQIVLAERHDIPHWLPIAYTAICERSKPLEEWEAEKIGYRKITLLARAREAIRNPHHNPPEPPSAPRSRASTPVSFIEESNTAPTRPSSSNGFYHNRARVNAIVSEIFFPRPHVELEGEPD
ncbi:hypothetical protein FB451DRAFT_1410140 [Mycena latifolia]|nr:hypothetical protein FB451DRAFT_1410140 [Mycena latifolia]